MFIVANYHFAAIIQDKITNRKNNNIDIVSNKKKIFTLSRLIKKGFVSR